MANTYQFKIHQLEAYVNKDGLDHVVYNIHYSYHVTDADSNEAYIYQMITVPEPDAENFTSFVDLTEDQVISWIENLVNMDHLNANIDAKLAEIVTPSKVSLVIGQDPNATEQPTGIV